MVVQPSLSDVVQAVYRRKWAVLLVMVIVGGLGAVRLANTVPVYRSQAILVVRFKTSPVPTSNLSYESAPDGFDENAREELVSAHIEILQSEAIARQTIEQIGLGKLYPGLVAHPPETGSAMDAAVQRFVGSILAISQGGNELRVSFDADTPDLARDTLGRLIANFTEREGRIFEDTGEGFRKQQADLAAQRLQAAQTALAKFKATAGLSDFKEQMGSLVTERVDLDARLHTAQVALTQDIQQRDALARLLPTIPAEIANSAGAKYRAADDAQARLDALQLREREMTASHGADWPAARALRARLAEAQRAREAMAAASADRTQTRRNPIYTGLQTDLLRVTAKVEGDQKAVAAMTSEGTRLAERIDALEALRAGLADRQRELDLADTAYRTISLQLEDARIGADVVRDGISRIAYIIRPDTPMAPNKPRYKVEAIAAAAAAVYAGLFAAFLLEFFDDRFISAKQVSARLEIPVLATFDKV